MKSHKKSSNAKFKQKESTEYASLKWICAQADKSSIYSIFQTSNKIRQIWHPFNDFCDISLFMDY